MTDEKIIDLAERYGWLENIDHYGLVWVFAEDALLDFASDIQKAERERIEQ